MVQKENEQKVTSDYIDSCIGIYYHSKNFREKETLGEFLAVIIRDLSPSSVRDYLTGKPEKDQ